MISGLMTKRFVGQSFPHAIVGGVADLAVRYHGPTYLERGGPASRARSVFASGETPAVAARIAARQGKGHIAEVRVAAELSLDSGLRGLEFDAALNGAANHPHEDVLVRMGRTKVKGAQIGVGHPRYLAAKARRSRADLLVVNTEALKAVQKDWNGTSPYAADLLHHEDTRSAKLSGARAEDDATAILERMIVDEPTVTFELKASVVASSGAVGFATSFGRSLLLQAVHRLHTEQRFDGSMIDTAMSSGIEALKRTSLATWIQVSRFLERAGSAFDGKLLRALGGSSAVAGAVAEVVVSTAKEVVAWTKNEITFEELLRRFGVNAFSAGGALAGGAIALALSARAGMPGWLTALVTAIGAAGGGYLGLKLGEDLFAPTWNVRPAI